jgi:two-component system sensor histidine kinase PhoQ
MKPAFTGSIHSRVLLAATFVLTAFLGLTGFSLDAAFRSSLDEALKARLKSEIYGIIAAGVEDQQGRFALPEKLANPGFNLPDSGLYALVRSQATSYVWTSESMVGLSLDFQQPTAAGQFLYGHSDFQKRALRSLSFGIIWEDLEGREIDYVISVAADMRNQREQLQTFRDTLFLWLGGAALLLLIAQGWVLRWGLQPLRRVAKEIKAIESGGSERLEGDYPSELLGLTGSLNSLIQHASTRQQRYRDSLGDLAHSLKTPLAILQGLADQTKQEQAVDQQSLTEQVGRMNQIISHQLQRAAASGSRALVKGVAVHIPVERIASSLEKVYREKQINIEVAVHQEARFPGEEADLMELMGNLMDNGCKYGNNRVRVSSVLGPGCLELHVEDDGIGIPAEEIDQVLRRGGRIDMRQPGQGIGLAVAADIVDAYGGELGIGRSILGGAEVTVTIPRNLNSARSDD